MEKIDLKKKYACLYKPSAKKVEIVDVPSMSFAMVDGVIEPGYGPSTSPAFQNAVQALYGISYTLKFTLKKRLENPIDYPVMALEGLWWVDSGEFDIRKPSNWHWTAMIMQPEPVTTDLFRNTIEDLRKKKPNPALDLLRLQEFTEGLSVQRMHLGPYSREMDTLTVIESFCHENGYQFRGKHHEIYMGDPRRADPEKLKTILRHPVEKIDEVTHRTDNGN